MKFMKWRSLILTSVMCLSPILLGIALWNSLPKVDYVKNFKMDTETARKINRFLGFETVIMGVLALEQFFCPPLPRLSGCFC